MIKALLKGVEGGWFRVGDRVLWRQPPQLKADPQHQPQFTSPDRLAPRTSLGSVVPPISLRSSTVMTLALSSSQAAHAQHGSLRRSIAGDHVLHVILLDVGVVIYIPQILLPLKSLGLDLQRVKNLALKLHARSVHYARKLVQTRRSLEHSPLSEER